jgi:hypothetical protein
MNLLQVCKDIQIQTQDKMNDWLLLKYHTLVKILKRNILMMYMDIRNQAGDAVMVVMAVHVKITAVSVLIKDLAVSEKWGVAKVLRWDLAVFHQ